MSKPSVKSRLDVFKEWTPLIVALLTVLGSLILFYLTEESKREYQEYIRKEQKYLDLIVNMRAFDVESNDISKRDQFNQKVDECWMYCSDDVVRKASNFLKSVNIHSNTTQEEKRKAYAEVILAIRKDLKEKTTLTSNDFVLSKAINTKITNSN